MMQLKKIILHFKFFIKIYNFTLGSKHCNILINNVFKDKYNLQKLKF